MQIFVEFSAYMLAKNLDKGANMSTVDIEKIRKQIPCYDPEMKKPDSLSMDDCKEMLYRMCIIREFEMHVKDLWRAGKIRGLCHAYYYAEAIAVGACTALPDGSYITSTHRGHGHVLARGGDPKRMFAELFGRVEGYNNGKGGSMHIADVDNGILGATGIVGSGIAPATGAALSAKLQKNDRVSLCFFGDGGSNQGAFYESLNMAAAWELPVIFLCECNQWAIGTNFNRVTKEPDIYKRAAGFGVPGVQVDGLNVFDVYNAVLTAVERARAGEGPTLIEAKYMRMLGHHVGDDQVYRTKEDIEEISVLYNVEPIIRMKDFLEENGVDKEEAEAIHERAREEIAKAVEYAENECHDPDLDTLYKDIYANGEIIE